MKRLFLIVLCLLIPFSVFAWDAQEDDEAIIALLNVAGGVSCDSCTGDLLFSWQVEGTDATDALNVDSGSAPACGCSVGDTTATLESQASIVAAPTGRTGFALKSDGAYDSATFAISSADIFKSGTGRVEFDLYVETWVDFAEIFNALGLINEDYMKIELYSSRELRVVTEGSNAGGFGVQTPAADLALSTWYSVVLQYRLGSSNPSISLTVNASTGTSDTDLTAWSNLPTELTWGDLTGSAGAAVYYLKNMRTYSTYE